MSRASNLAALSMAGVVMVGLVPGAAVATDRDVEGTCADAPDAGFTDVPDGNVHRRSIDCIRHHGVTLGKTADTYDPSGVLARDQLATFLDRTLSAGGHALPAATQDWFDDDDGSPHEAAINRLAEAGIVATANRTFGVKVAPTRAEMSRLTAAALLWAGAITDAAKPPDFFLDDETSPDELPINQLTDAGIVTGKGDAQFAPAELLRRDQMATFLARAIDALLDGPGSHHHCRIHPPERPRFDDWYQQQCEVFGIAVVASERVDAAALPAVVDVIIGMLGERPELHAQLASTSFYLAIIAEEEGVTDLPEYRFLKDDPNTDWDARARGFGDSELASAGEENVLCRDTDPYLGESILVHEFSHSILSAAIGPLETDFRGRVAASYDDAMAAGRWQDTYAATDHDEFWAEGVQDWFDTNLEADPPDSIHNHVNTREELLDYEPALHALIAEQLSHDWRYACP